MSTYATVSSAPLGVSSSAPAAARAASTGSRRDGARGLAALLLAAVVSSLVVLADQLISTWADGHLFLGWVISWVVVFAGLALFADSARKLSRRAIASLDAWSRAVAEKRAEERLWDIARSDPRVMSDLVSARSRADESTPAPAPVAVAATAETIAPSDMGFWEKLGRERAGRALY